MAGTSVVSSSCGLLLCVVVHFYVWFQKEKGCALNCKVGLLLDPIKGKERERKERTTFQNNAQQTYSTYLLYSWCTVRRKAIPSLFPNEKSRIKHQAKRIESVYFLLNKTLMKEGRCLIIHQTKAPTKLNLDSGNCF